MSQYPINELKRHLEDDTTPLPKRLRLAKNVAQSHHFPTAPKERVIAEWVIQLIQDNKIKSNDLRDILDWLNAVDDLTSNLKCKIIKVVALYVDSNTLQDDDICNILSFLGNSKVSAQLSVLIENFLLITKRLLQHLYNVCSENAQQVQTILNIIIKYYKESKKKQEFIVKLVYGKYLETIFSYLNTEFHGSVISVCQNILFPMSKKQSYSTIINHLIRTDSIDQLESSKIDNMQSTIKVLKAFFTLPDGTVEGDHNFIINFIDTFVTCYRSEGQIIFMFYVLVTSVLNISQNYIMPVTKLPPIMFVEHNDKIKRNIFLKMLQILLKNDVDIGVSVTDIHISKATVKKTFMSFLQIVMHGQLKLEGKLDKTTLNIIKTAIKLDPSFVEQKMDLILPHIMIAKKNNSDFLQSYTEMMNCLLETLFKLSRGTDFLNQMISHLKLSLEASNIEQFELKQKLNETANHFDNHDKIKGKIITGNDIFPLDCVELYGKLTSELLFRQSKDLLTSLQKDFEENCLMMLEEGFVSPSIITLAEMLAAILSSFLHHSKMADHTVPLNIAEEFWSAFQDFEDQCLNKFGECILKLNYNPSLVVAFLKLCLSFSHLKLLNIKYSNTKLNVKHNNLLPFLNKDKWLHFASKLQEDEANILWIQVLVTKMMAIEILLNESIDEETSNLVSETKTNIIKQLSNYPQILLYNNYITRNLFRNLDKNQLKQLSKSFLKSYAHYSNIDIFKTEALINNRELLQTLILKVAKNICDCIENADNLSKALSKSTFDVRSFVKEIDIKKYLTDTIIQNRDEIEQMVGILKLLQIHYLDENSQLTAIFVLLLVKQCCHTKKLKRNIDDILRSIYELSPKYPDLYKLFSVDFVFDFNDNTLLELLKLTIKTPNDTLILKSILELAVKKVKTDSEIVKNIVEILLKNHKSKKSNIENFRDPVFQISCLILPLINKEKRAITTSAYRSILASLQDKLNKAMVDSFKDVDFSSDGSFCAAESGNTDDSLVVSENTVATLNAMGAYTLTLLKYCESNIEEMKSMDCLLNGLEFFVQNAIQTIQTPSSKNQHIEISVNLLNVTLRYIKKFETHKIFQNRDKLFHQIWRSIKNRLVLVYNQKKEKISNQFLDEIAVTLKFLAELSSVECFSGNFVGDLSNLALLKKPSVILKNADITKSQLTSRKVSKYLWQNCLKASIIEPKCVALTKLISRSTKNIKFWMQQHYDCVQNGGRQDFMTDGDDFVYDEIIDKSLKIMKIDDSICEILRCDLDILSEVILAAKKISLDYKFLDLIFELHHLMHYILGRNTHTDTKCDISWQGFVCIYGGCVAILNNLLLSREELLEDRWPCYMQNYKALVLCLCEKSTTQNETDKAVEHKLAEMAHSVEKLTQSICKRKAHVSRISAYAVADICTWLESNPPPKMVRQHIENSIALLIQVSDSTHSMAFLRRALAGSVGQMTLTNMYTMYKRYHKYVGNT